MSASMICRPWYGAPISDPDKIARAIFAGFQSELLAQDAGLVELQFPVGTGTQDRLFGVVQDDLAGTNLAAAAGAGAAAPGGGIQILHLPAHKRPTLANGKDPKPDKKGGEGVDDDGDAIELQNTQAAARAQANAGRAVVAGLSGQQWLLKKKAWKYVDGTSTQQAGVTADHAAKYSDASDFYDKTAGGSNPPKVETGTEAIVCGTLGVAALQDDAMVDREYGCLTVWVRDAKTGTSGKD